MVDSLRKLDEKTTVICAPTGFGVSALVNMALSQVHTDRVAVLNSGDVRHSEHLGTQITECEGNPSLVLVGTRANLIDVEGEFVGRRGIQ